MCGDCLYIVKKKSSHILQLNISHKILDNKYATYHNSEIDVWNRKFYCIFFYPRQILKFLTTSNEEFSKPLNLIWAGGGALSATIFGDRLLLLNSCTYGFDTYWLFLNIKNENFGQNLNLKFLPQPPSEGGTKKMIFLKIGRRA